MRIDCSSVVETNAASELLWRRMLDPSAVIGFLGGDATEIRPFELSGHGHAGGHTFRIKGVGGGVYHARIDRLDRHTTVSYAIWREDASGAMCLLSYNIQTSGSLTVLAGEITMDMPLEELLASVSLVGVLATPLVGRLVRGYVFRRLRRHLLSMAAPGEQAPVAG